LLAATEHADFHKLNARIVVIARHDFVDDGQMKRRLSATGKKYEDG
jgi:hypothetical protein